MVLAMDMVNFVDILVSVFFRFSVYIRIRIETKYAHDSRQHFLYVWSVFAGAAGGRKYAGEKNRENIQTTGQERG